MEQLDIFSELEKVEWQDKKKNGDVPPPTSWKPGDVFIFKTYGGKEVTGRYITSGFWDGRDQQAPEYHFFDVDGEFVEITVSSRYRSTDYVRIEHDHYYLPPDKKSIKDKLIDVLIGSPMDKWIPLFQRFKNNYPYLSFEYHPFIKDAWEKATIELVTEKMLIDYKKVSREKVKVPKHVKQYLALQIINLEGEYRWKELMQLQWDKEKLLSPMEKPTDRKFKIDEQNFTYWKAVIRHHIENTANVDALAAFIELWGITCVS